MSNSNSNNNSDKYEKTFEIPIPVAPDSIVAVVSDAEKLTLLSFQIVGTISGTPDITFTLVQKNKSNAPWYVTDNSKSIATAGLCNEFIEVDPASAESYALKVSIIAGSIDALRISVIGKG